MSKESSFIEDKNGHLLTKRKQQTKGSSIIKNHSVKVGQKRKIEPQNQFFHGQPAQVEPIKENDTIVGVVVHCGCGEKIEVQFEYE